MRKSFLASIFAVAICVSGPACAADEYAVDPVHSSVTFKISHLGLAYIHGRFNDYSGTFNLGSDKPSFALSIKADTVDTANAKRDEHLRAPDFFNVKQFPAITFKSTSVKPGKDGYQVTGDLTLHGVTKPVTFALSGGKKAEFPKGVHRVGYSTDLTIKRSEFGMTALADALGDEVHIAISLEAVKK